MLWASYAALLGYFGGKQFEDAPWKGLLLAFAIAVSIAGRVELVGGAIGGWKRAASSRATNVRRLACGAPTATERGQTMTAKADFNEEEWKLVSEGRLYIVCAHRPARWQLPGDT